MSVFLLDFRLQKAGGPVTPGHLYKFEAGVEVDWDGRLAEFRAMTSGQRVLMLVHGYNNDRPTGRTRLARFGDMLDAGGNSDVKVAILWPGDGWAKALTYPFEGRDADDTAASLFTWISRHVSPDASLAFAGHSLGCRVVMNLAQRLAKVSPRSKAPAVDRITLMAPAINNDCLGQPSRDGYRAGTLDADRIAVLASEQDEVLRFAFPAGDFLQLVFFRERFGRALGRTGPRERDAQVVAKIEPVPLANRARQIDHGDYLDVAQNTTAPTIAESEVFVLQFLNRVTPPRWPAQR